MSFFQGVVTETGVVVSGVIGDVVNKALHEVDPLIFGVNDPESSVGAVFKPPSGA